MDKDQILAALAAVDPYDANAIRDLRSAAASHVQIDLGITIDLALAMSTLGRLTANEPDRANGSVNGACVYVIGGKPGCIIGNLLIHLGVPIDRFVPVNQAGEAFLPNDETGVASLVEYLPNVGVHVTGQAKRLMTEVQAAADNSGRGDIPWGVAFATGVQRYAESWGFTEA